MHNADPDDHLVTLFRAVGQSEYDRICVRRYHSFPPRLPPQQTLYLVLDEGYAMTTARDWHAQEARSGYRGYVVRARVRADFLHRYPLRYIGVARNPEYWIPSEDVSQFNRNIVGPIDVIAEFGGEKANGHELA